MDNNILPTGETTEFENRYYINPQLGIDESNTFIDKLRESQGQQNQEIFTDTQRLGTDVPTNLGGLTGAGSYFTSRYQTPQTVSAISDLKSAAQASALNDVLANEKAKWQKRYNDAYRAYQKRANNNGGGGGYGNNDGRLPYDVNPEDTNNNADEFVETIGTVIPLTETSSKYRDPKTGIWYLLTPPTEIDSIALTNSFAGRNPVDGMTTTVNGKVFRYDAASNMWRQQVYMFGQGE